jgi:NAD(P)-dependent dehydrogenase (short-subunit alcohol dehydrogenase family)
MSPSLIANRLQNHHNFDVDKSIPELSSKVIIVTGGNTGIGKATVLTLARHHPKRLYATARTKEKFDSMIRDVIEEVPDAKIDFLEMDLACLASVSTAADKVLAENDRLDVVINNAGKYQKPPQCFMITTCLTWLWLNAVNKL